MRALIVAAAPDPVPPARLASLANDCDLVIACDAGATALERAGVTPDVAVGDFDSLSPQALERLAHAGARIVRFPQEKDETDFDLALAEARSLGATEVDIASATGGTPDHALAVFGSLAHNADLRPSLHGADWSAAVLAPAGRAQTSVPQGATFSVIALVDSATVTCRGTRWELECAPLPALGSLGIGNVAEQVAAITVHTGCALVVVRECQP